MPAERTDVKYRMSTIAGLIAVSAATLLMMAWAIFPSVALADGSVGSSMAEAGTSTTTEATTITSGNNPIYSARDASSACNENGHVIIRAYIQNNSATLSLTVTVTDITFAGETATAVVPPGASHTFFLDAGVGPLPSGLVAYHVEWDGGQADFTREHSSTKCPAQSTTTTTTHSSSTSTTPGGSTTSTTPGGSTTSTMSTTSTTDTTSTTETTASGTTVTPPSSSSTTPFGTTVSATTVSPGGTAFTGLENVVPLGTIALILMTGGSGLLWAGVRRRRDDVDNSEE